MHAVYSVCNLGAVRDSGRGAASGALGREVGQRAGPRAWHSVRVQPLSRLPAVWLVLGAIVVLQSGAAIAKDLFVLIPPTAMVWMRLLVSAVILLVAARPRVGSGRSWRDWVVIVAFGTCLMVMNWSIYQSFARIPLGVAATIEFLGPLAVAVVGSRRAIDFVWVLLAGAGVALLGLAPGSLSWSGVGFALLAALSWAGYILLSAETGRRWPGLSGLALASVVGTVVLAGPAIADAGTRLLQPKIFLLGLAVGVLSSVIPYSLELMALRRIPPRVFGILMSLEPAAAALAAMILLAEFLNVTQWLALACVVIASAGATRMSKPPAEPTAI
jgi:inner membrane transporter RhtA